MVQRPYGTWKSAITPRMMAGSNRLNDVQWSSDGKTLVWSERRDGKTRLVARTEGEPTRDLTDTSLKIGGGVGYGGGDFTLHGDKVYFCASNQLYAMPLGAGPAKVLTPQFGSVASPAVSADGRWVLYVHTYQNDDVLAIVDSEGKQWPQKLAQGDDFVMQPVWHPHGKYVAYIAWNAPNMPWNGTELRLLTLRDDEQSIPYVTNQKTIAGDENTAIFQPTFSPAGRFMAYISDETGYSQLYLYDPVEGTHTQLTDGDYEYGTPAWTQGLRTYAWSADGSAIYYIRNDKGFCTLWQVSISQKSNQHISDLGAYTYQQQIDVAPNGKLAFIASSSQIPPRIATYDAQGGTKTIHFSMPERLPKEDLAETQLLEWPTRDGQIAYGMYAMPTSSKYSSEGKPPLIVLVHGGPTSQRYANYDADVQFFATRGYAVLQVNHRGSTGFGKAYMDMHKTNWGIYDVQDSIDAVNYLAEEGLIDKERVAIMGGSAGGFTVLQSLVDAPGFYKVGICSYGVANQFSLAMETHKFEASYNDWLLGPLPEASQLYRDRSPIYHADKIQDTMLVFQGVEDPVVPKNQSDSIVAVLERNGVPHEYHIYEGEGHGFRKPENIIDYYETIERFLLTHLIYA